MKKFLAITAILAALGYSVQAQSNENAVAAHSGGSYYVAAHEMQPVRWKVTGSSLHSITVRYPRFGFANYGTLGNARVGTISGRTQQISVEMVETLEDGQIRVSLRYDPIITRTIKGVVQRVFQGELIGGDVQLRHNFSSAIIDSDPVVSATEVVL
jgi:opacity protein-like surface antigen